MKQFTTESGETFEIRPLTAAISDAASRNLAREGIVISASSPIHDNLEFQAEIIRLVLARWELPDGSQPLMNLRPAKARQLIRETEGLETVFDAARKLAEEAGKARKIDLGN